MLAVCYIPPDSLCCGGSSEETLQRLGEKVAEFSSLGFLVICGDFNARCGNLEAEVEGLPPRKIIDRVRNSQGEAFVDFLRSVDMCIVMAGKEKMLFLVCQTKGARWWTMVWRG